ncbi:hypothetical protein RND81_11G172800 [Saponaria officinalis]|uniref:non-specific serine/threonine protein kinase n=1 Tax=Saponaria officinalis TaxID=3572 RepID=A0AAW1HNS2_SAPOF
MESLGIDGGSSSPPGPPSDSNSSPSPPSDNNPSQPSPPSDGQSTPSTSEDNNNNNNNNNNKNNNDNNNNDGSSNDNNDNNGDNNNNNNNNDNSRPSSESRNNNSPNTPSSQLSGGSNGGSRSPFSPPLRLRDGSSSSSSNTPLIAGLVLGIGVLLLLLIIIIIVLCCKKKKDKRPDTMQYYRDPSQKGQPQPQQQQQHYSGQHAPWQSSPMSQDMNYSSGATGMSMNQWGAPMAPPHDMSGGYSSGPTGPSLPPPHPSMALGFNKSSFTYEELAAATNGFSQANMLGQGGFGYVHKGVLPNGKEIAVKSLKAGSGQGEREFQAEVEIISRVHHRHLVSLAGYCIAGAQRMLVYEFVPNNTLEYHLHGPGRPVMDFPTRMRIALGSAKGLAYLHEDCHPRIIHRDIKTANILIDLSFEAKVADFGLAKLSSDTNTHVSTRIMGTFGYLAPEYASSGKLTEKSDVFSFGIMLLELVTGRRPIDPNSEDEDTLVDWSRPLISRAIEEGVFDELVDPRLKGEYDPQEMLRLIACAGSSVRHSAKRRPKMSQIVRALEGDVSLDDLNGGPKQGNSSAFSSSGGSSDYDTMSYNNDMKKFRKIALGSTDYTSSEYGATNEYDHV